MSAISNWTLTMHGTGPVPHLLEQADQVLAPFRAYPDGDDVGVVERAAQDQTHASTSADSEPRFGPPGLGDVVDFIEDNVRFRGTVLALREIAPVERGRPSTMEVAVVGVVGHDRLFCLSRNLLGVVRRSDPDHHFR